MKVSSSWLEAEQNVQNPGTKTFITNSSLEANWWLSEGWKPQPCRKQRRTNKSRVLWLTPVDESAAVLCVHSRQTAVNFWHLCQQWSKHSEIHGTKVWEQQGHPEIDKYQFENIFHYIKIFQNQTKCHISCPFNLWAESRNLRCARLLLLICPKGLRSLLVPVQ